MPPTDTNARIAREVMGWHDNPEDEGFWFNNELLDGKPVIVSLIYDFDPEHSLDACAIAEAEIERRGLWIHYEFELQTVREAQYANCDRPWMVKYLIRLTPTQRCVAMLAAVGAKP